MRLLFRFILLASTFLGTAHAEPWVSTRYAQNCAGCHSPGRKNLPVTQRRCTLACQGCHVNPNGGGLRSYYGKWNEDRWLRSFAPPGSYKPTATSKMQKYQQEQNLYKPGAKPPPGGFPLAELKSIPPDSKESLFDRRDGIEKIMSSSREEFEYNIPVGDPYRFMDELKLDAGADVRWQFRQGATITSATDKDGNAVGDITTDSYWRNFPMVADVGIGARPFHRKLRIIYETRATDTHQKRRDVDKIGAATMSRRSLYAMIDDLPLNLYVMGGFYRPMVGYYTPDHTMVNQVLQNELFGNPYRQEFLAYSIGGSPNMPYFNAHYIVRGTNPERKKLDGFGLNLGSRFVTKGISINYTFFDLSDRANMGDEYDEKLLIKARYHDLYGSIQIWRITTTLDLQSLEYSDPVKGIALKRGGSYTSDTMFQIWRGLYANFQYGFANCAPDLLVGLMTQTRFGVRWFTVPGMEYMLHYEIEHREKNDAATGAVAISDTLGLMAQVHLFM